MVGTRNSPADASSYLRKIRKPMVEKQRRERMNQSISQLKMLIASTIKQQVAPMTRVDKADILELTVFHLTQLQQQQRSVTMATEAAAYRTGFKDCAREAVTYLTNSRIVPETTACQLSEHLHDAYVASSRNHHRNHQASCALQNESGNRSTPIRHTNIDTPRFCTPQFNAIDYSPIVYHGNEPSFSETTLDDTSRSYPSYTCSDGELLLSNMSVSTDTTSSCSTDDNDASSGVVTIGNGSENEIGHMINETIWRPW